MSAEKKSVENNDILIKVVDLKKNFGDLQVLKGVSEDIRKGEVVSVIGPSGGGKSTFLRCLNLLEIPDGGKVYFYLNPKPNRQT